MLDAINGGTSNDRVYHKLIGPRRFLSLDNVSHKACVMRLMRSAIAPRRIGSADRRMTRGEYRRMTMCRAKSLFMHYAIDGSPPGEKYLLDLISSRLAVHFFRRSPLVAPRGRRRKIRATPVKGAAGSYSSRRPRARTRREVFCSDRKSTRLNSSHSGESRMPSSA